MSLPSVDVVRERIESIPDIGLQLCCQAAYLWCARISEVVSKAYGKERAYGPKAGELDFADYEGHDVAIFDVHTAKRNGMLRKIALPLDFNPWAKELVAYYQKLGGKDPAFPFYRQFVWRNVTRYFEDLSYPIESYLLDDGVETDEQGKVIKHRWKPILAHQKAFCLHALRHLRATELVEHYGFDGFNLAAYGGWTISTAQAFFGASIPLVISRYLYMNWQGYITKLLRK